MNFLQVVLFKVLLLLGGNPHFTKFSSFVKTGVVFLLYSVLSEGIHQYCSYTAEVFRASG